MSGLFAGTPLERPVTCPHCEKPVGLCTCSRDVQGKVTLPQDQDIRIRRESRRGKMVTVLTGFTARSQDLEPLLKSLKQKFASGGTLTERTIELQGDHRDAAVIHLRGLGYTRVKAAGG